MAIPVHATTITVLRVPADPERDPYEEQPQPQPVATGVRAVIYSPTGEEQVRGDSRSNTYHRLTCDPIDLDASTDTIRDETTGLVYDLEWSEPRIGFGMDHTACRLRRTTGVV